MNGQAVWCPHSSCKHVHSQFYIRIGELFTKGSKKNTIEQFQTQNNNYRDNRTIKSV